MDNATLRQWAELGFWVEATAHYAPNNTVKGILSEGPSDTCFQWVVADEGGIRLTIDPSTIRLLPRIDAWLAGGCALCGKPERGQGGYCHVECDIAAGDKQEGIYVACEGEREAHANGHGTVETTHQRLKRWEGFRVRGLCRDFLAPGRNVILIGELRHGNEGHWLVNNGVDPGGRPAAGAIEPETVELAPLFHNSRCGLCLQLCDAEAWAHRNCARQLTKEEIDATRELYSAQVDANSEKKKEPPCARWVGFTVEAQPAHESMAYGNVVGLLRLSHTLWMVTTKSTSYTINPATAKLVPNLEAWKNGGCALCGEPDRGSSTFAHDKCADQLTEDEMWSVWVAVRNYAPHPPPPAPTGPKFPAPKPEPTIIGFDALYGGHFKTIDRAIRFFAGLNLQDHPREEQRERESIVRELIKVLRGEKVR
jgi:hypothetical protein